MVVKPLANSKIVNVWLLKDKPVTVLSIQYAPTVGSQYIIWSNIHGGVSLFSSSEFEIVDPKLPINWKAVLDLNGNVELIPQEWASLDFWNKYNEDDPATVKLFDTVFKEMTKSEHL